MNKFKIVFVIAVITLAIYACSKEEINSNDDSIIIPAWFSPDGDGIKDEWKVEDPLNLINNSEFSAKIYDTAHKLVFVKFDKNIAWLGNKSDSTIACDTGYYYYAVQYKYWSGKSKFRFGNVFLSRKKP
jgi:gliding motility-associated-like protein